jgi:hypothetical protein
LADKFEFESAEWEDCMHEISGEILIGLSPTLIVIFFVE